MSLTLPQGKVANLKQKCYQLIKHPQTTLGDMASLLGHLCPTAQAVLPAFLQMRYLQHQYIQVSKQSQNPHFPYVLNENSIQELEWWMNNLELYNGRSLLNPSMKIVIQTDASKKGWGAFCQNHPIGGRWTLQESEKHINVLELMAIHLALLTYKKMFKLRNVHFQLEQMGSLVW